MLKRVLLINPPESGRGVYSPPPLGLLYIAGVLQANKIPVKVVDGFLDGWQAITEELKVYKPHIIGITCATYSRSKALLVAKIAKQYAPQALTIVGGTHPTIMGRQLLENYPFIDMVAIGESDYLLLDLCKGTSLDSISGLGFRKNNKVIINPAGENISDLDSLPFPAWNLVAPIRYRADEKGFHNGINLNTEPCVGVSFSRGCVGNCSFCSNRLMWKKWRHRSPENMADELELLNKSFGVKHIRFQDDCFSVNKKATISLCGEIVDRKLEIAFDVVTRTDCIDDQVLGALKEAGCYKIRFGIETASPKLLKAMDKSINIQTSINAIRLAGKYGIKTVALVIAGSIGEDYRTINETVDFLLKAGPTEIGVANGLMIFPGTRIYDLAKEKGVIEDSFWLTDYNWKVYTAENSRLKLNIFCSALYHRKKIPPNYLFNILKYNRFLMRQIGYELKEFLLKYKLIRKKNKRHKYKIAY